MLKADTLHMTSELGIRSEEAARKDEEIRELASELALAHQTCRVRVGSGPGRRGIEAVGVTRRAWRVRLQLSRAYAPARNSEGWGAGHCTLG